jgi:hypothetical protein
VKDNRTPYAPLPWNNMREHDLAAKKVRGDQDWRPLGQLSLRGLERAGRFSAGHSEVMPPERLKPEDDERS